jgi:hypothetical protein
MLTFPVTFESNINRPANQSGQPVNVFFDKLISDYLDNDNEILEADPFYRRIQTGQAETVSFEQLLRT